MTEPDFSGSVINSRYRLRRQIGSGGMATVYEATDQELHKPVAVKVLKEEWCSNTSMVARFRHEPRVAAQVQNEHLVDVSDRGITGEGTPFFVMEFLEGRSLSQELLEEPGPMPWRRAVELSLQICSALAALHGRGLVHRDIKPGNCFLLRRGDQTGDFVKVLDLGIAKVVEGSRDMPTHPQTGTAESAPFTPEYASPEQARGETVDARSDLYSLGVVMYQLLAGRRPFVRRAGDESWQLLEMHCKQPPPRLQALAPDADIPEALEHVVLRCLEKEAEARWASATQLAEALRAVEVAERQAREYEAGTRTARYQPPEPPYALPRALHRALMFAHGFMLFLLSFMVMVMIDLPGVGPLAEYLRPPPVTKPPPPEVVQMDDEPSEPPVERATAKEKTAAVDPVPPPAIAPAPEPEPEPERTAVLTKEAAVQDADPPPPSRKEVVRAAGRPSGVQVVEAPVKKKPTEKPDQPPGKVASPKQLVQRFLDKNKSRFAECAETVAYPRTFSVQLWVNAQGRIIGTSVITEAKTILGRCIQGALQGLMGRSIAGIKAAGSHSGEVELK